MPAWQVPRTCKGWIQLGKKLAPYNVKANKLFKAGTIKDGGCPNGLMGIGIAGL